MFNDSVVSQCACELPRVGPSLLPRVGPSLLPRVGPSLLPRVGPSPSLLPHIPSWNSMESGYAEEQYDENRSGHQAEGEVTMTASGQQLVTCLAACQGQGVRAISPFVQFSRAAFAASAIMR